MIIGIDPGKNGAIVKLQNDGEVVEKHVMPLVGKLLDMNALKNLFLFQYNERLLADLCGDVGEE